MPVVRVPRPPMKQSEVQQKGASAKQLQMFFQIGSKQHVQSDLVAEPRLSYCGIRSIDCFVLTLFITMLVITTTTIDVGPSEIRDSTMFSTILATTTAMPSVDSELSTISTTDLAISTATGDRHADGSGLLTDLKKLTDVSTLFTTTLATPTTKNVDEERIVDFVSRVFDKSHQHARSAMDRMDRLHQSVNDELKPPEVLNRLHELGLLDDDEVKEFKAMSLRERGAVMVEANDSAERPSDDVDIRHDPWWFGDDGAVTHGEPEDVTVRTVFHGTLSSATHHPGDIDSSSVWNVTDDSDIHGRFFQRVIGRMLQSHDVTLTDVGQLSSMLIPEKKGTNDVRSVHWSMKYKLNIVLMLAGSSLILSAVCMMQHQNQRFGHRMQSPYQQDVGAATLKTPPAWCYENAAQYALRSWLSDVLMWSSATDVEVERQGPSVALQITGVARDLIREINPQHLREGIHEQGVHIPGLMLLCRTLANHFAPLESELQTRAMAESMNFARKGHETIDVSLTRFEVLRHRAAQRGGLMMNTTTLSYLLLNGLRSGNVP